MRNPVKLPSGHIVDRSSIARALLSDPIDPFTREHCTLEMLEEDLELKSQVEAWLNEKLGRSS